MISSQEYALLSVDVYLDSPSAKLAGSGWSIVSNFPTLSDDAISEGFFAWAYQRGDEIVIAFRGTDNLLNDADESIAAYAGIAPRPTAPCRLPASIEHVPELR